MPLVVMWKMCEHSCLEALNQALKVNIRLLINEFDRDASDEVMNGYRVMLDKINDGRDRTDEMIKNIAL